MAWNKRNEYLPGQDLNNMAVNVDDNRLENDQTYITVDFGTTPATVTVKIGSLVEINGSQYNVVTTDEVFQMANNTDNYITFDGTTLASSSTQGAYDEARQGFYVSGNTRVLRWYIEQSTEKYFINKGLKYVDNPYYSDPDLSEVCSVGLTASLVTTSSSGTVPFDAPLIDTFSLYDAVNYEYTVAQTGNYDVSLYIQTRNTVISTSGSTSMNIDINGTDTYQLPIVYPIASKSIGYGASRTIPLSAGDIIRISFVKTTGGTMTIEKGSASGLISQSGTLLSIKRV